MYIHRSKFKGHNKYLLRASYRRAGRTGKVTLLSLTQWSAEAIARLEAALQLKRASRGKLEQEIQADELTLSVLYEQGLVPHSWRSDRIWNVIDYSKRYSMAKSPTSAADRCAPIEAPLEARRTIPRLTA